MSLYGLWAMEMKPLGDPYEHGDDKRSYKDGIGADVQIVEDEIGHADQGEPVRVGGDD